MQLEAYNRAVSEAKRFLEAAKKVKVNDSYNGGGKCLDVCTKQSGALKRASLDLTRALAEMRRP